MKTMHTLAITAPIATLAATSLRAADVPASAPPQSR